MQRIFIIACSILIASITTSFGQDKEKMIVESSVESLKQLMINPDKAKLESLLTDQLTYGHSNGLIENKTQCIENLVSGNSDFVDITQTNQQSNIMGNTAWVRFDLFAHTNNKGVPGETKLKVLLIWVKDGKNWKLLARQAVKLVPA
ncbi:MAG: nuclear transport factor 2 family protein [Saprospiraceae bacterium]